MSGVQRTDTQTPTVSELTIATLACLVSILLLVAGAAAYFWRRDLGGDARAVFGFRFDGVPPTPTTALRIALDNGRLAVAILLCAFAVAHLPRWAVWVADLAVGLLLLINAEVIGIALAAYGTRLLRAVAWHLPPELTALSLAGGAYLTARRNPLKLDALARIAALCILLLAVAAVLETYLPPAAGP